VKRSPLPSRTTSLPRSRPRKAGKRKPSEFARIYGSKARVLFVKSLDTPEARQAVKDAAADTQARWQRHLLSHEAA
jgi:hypothetical protein